MFNEKKKSIGNEQEISQGPPDNVTAPLGEAPLPESPVQAAPSTPGTKPSLKKSKAEYPAIHEMFLELTPTMSLLEIQDELDLSPAQLDRHLLHALHREKRKDFFTGYITIRAKTLPDGVRELLDVGDEHLIKIEKQEGGKVVLTALSKMKGDGDGK